MNICERTRVSCGHQAFSPKYTVFKDLNKPTATILPMSQGDGNFNSFPIKDPKICYSYYSHGPKNLVNFKLANYFPIDLRSQS
jgi:hypothetical protein